MFYGVQYYPEHWPEERWAVDAQMMQEAGINLVRMGEFAWSALEPREGQLEFGWMDRAVALLDAHGIKTLMCTPSRTPPPWVFHRYPGVRNVDANGQTQNYGRRYTIGLSHAEFVQLAQRIDRALELAKRSRRAGRLFKGDRKRDPGQQFRQGGPEGIYGRRTGQESRDA